MISVRGNEQALQEIQKIYAEIADDDRDLAEDFLSICAISEIED